ncbi:MAG TPA: AraC family transcriptional regulator [Chitinophaga sp.]|uniref:helix-turn-helix transcriptional regulator n=1 Tax=Chitinophaga sp. TaxID=1869181 RepID=UPI002BE63489|nr:AraC family transcriptional regulator [Chitinophaga sp.]HVI44992.1 AraC family transcriptional regulator [Chitinophaga sp.]
MIYHLPQVIFEGEGTPDDNIIIHDYVAAPGSFRGKSVLHMNAVSLVISGSKTMQFANSKVEVDSNSLHLLSSGNCLVSMDLVRGEEYRSILIFFDSAVLAEFLLKYRDRIGEMNEQMPVAGKLYLSFRKDAFIRNYITSLELLITNGKGLSGAMRQLKFEELMLHLLEQYPQELLSFQAGNKADAEDLDIRRTIEGNITSNIGIADMAFLCNTSISTFKRRFARLYGTTPNKWILHRRMEIARELLHHKEKPGEIYHKLGYENHSSFSKAFRQTYGVTPKDFQPAVLNVQH